MQLYIQYPSWISPEIIPGLPLRWYGLMYLFAFATAYFLFMYQVKKRKLEIESDDVLNLFFWAIVGLLIGARLFATTIYDPTGMYLRKPWLIFWPFNDKMQFTGIQGMSYHGGLVGVVIAVVIYTRVKKIDLLEWGDMLCAAIPLGYTFGRLGNFINGELYGRVTTAPWGMMFPTARRLPESEPWVQKIAAQLHISLADPDRLVNLPRHPSQLYEAFFEGIVLWLVIWFIFRNRRKFKGYIIAIYMMGYGIARFFIEYFRQPDPGLDFIIKLSAKPNPPQLLVTPWNFTTGQVLSFFMIVGGVICYFWFKWLADRQPKVSTFEKVPTTEKNRRRREKRK